MFHTNTTLCTFLYYATARIFVCHRDPRHRSPTLTIPHVRMPRHGPISIRTTSAMCIFVSLSLVMRPTQMMFYIIHLKRRAAACVDLLFPNAIRADVFGHARDLIWIYGCPAVSWALLHYVGASCCCCWFLLLLLFDWGVFGGRGHHHHHISL